jgi:hypothetical protein
MKGTQTALALGVGYVLGRRRKMRLTTMLAVAAAAGGAGGAGGAAVRRGVKMLGSTEMLSKVAPQVGEIADTLRDDLLDAGKAAATAAVTNRIESLTDSLHERAQGIREPAQSVTDQTAERIPKQRGRDEDADISRDEAREPEEGEEPEPDEAGENGQSAAPARRRTARAGSAVTRTRAPAASRTRR